MATAEVGLQDGHVGDGADYVEEEEDGAEGDVDANSGETAEGGGCGWIGTGFWEVGDVHCDGLVCVCQAAGVLL